MSTRKRISKKMVLWLVLAVLIGVEFFVYTMLDNAVDNRRYGKPLLTVTDFSLDGAQVTVTVENPTGRQYRGTPNIYLTDTPDIQEGFQMYLKPEGYYSRINRSGSENYENSTVIPPQTSVTLTCALTEEEQRRLEMLYDSAETLYACVPPSYARSDPDIQFYQIT